MTQITCTRCPATWTGPSRCHCSSESSVAVPLAVWDGDPGGLAQGYAELHQCPVDAGGVPAQALADLVRAETFEVQARRFVPPVGVAVHRAVLGSGHGGEILWSIVSPVPVLVMNLILGSDPTLEHPVFVGFEVLVRPDMPAKPDVSVGSRVTVRFARRDLLTGRKGANRSRVALGAARRAVATLRSPGDQLIAAEHRARFGHDNGHESIILQVTSLCHRTFAAPTLFDAHRHQRGERGGCEDPTRLLIRSGPRTGEPVMYLRDGIWSGPEMTAEQKAARFGVPAA